MRILYDEERSEREKKPGGFKGAERVGCETSAWKKAEWPLAENIVHLWLLQRDLGGLFKLDVLRLRAAEGTLKAQQRTFPPSNRTQLSIFLPFSCNIRSKGCTCLDWTHPPHSSTQRKEVSE
jgi:hypothetical protein